MSNFLNLAIESIDIPSQSIGALRSLINAARNDLGDRYRLIGTLGALFAASTQDNNLGTFSERADYELLGIQLMELSNEMQALSDFENKAEFYLRTQ